MKRRFDILVVDDEPVVTLAAGRILSSEGYSIDLVDDADAAVRRLKRNDYSLVLCDLMLPGIDGIELLDRVHRRLPGTLVVLITGYATLQRAVQAFRRGAVDFIPKPFDTFELIGVVQRGLGLARMGPGEREALGAELVDATTHGAGATSLYTLGRHGWALPDADGSVRIGPGETFAVLDEEIEELTTARPGDDLLQGNAYATIRTADRAAHRLWAPLSGRVLEVNARLPLNVAEVGWPRICRSWVVRIVPANLREELGNLTQRAAPRVHQEQPWSS